MAEIPITLNHVQGHAPICKPFQMGFLVQLNSSWHDFNWRSTSRGPSAIAAELLVFNSLPILDLLHSIIYAEVTTAVMKHSSVSLVVKA